MTVPNKLHSIPEWVAAFSLVGCLSLLVAGFAAVPLLLALGTAPGDIVGHLVGLEGRVELYREKFNAAGRSLGWSWLEQPKKGQALSIQDELKTFKDPLSIGSGNCQTTVGEPQREGRP